MTARYQVFDPLFGDERADAMLRLCAEYGSYGMYSEEGTADDWGTGLPQRFDAAFNFVGSGGRFARPEPAPLLAARTNYFRETYAYGDRIHGRPIVRPAISYANLLVPGQELAVHTDVPEFRGMSRLNSPQWLLVVMHHSRLFDRWRMPIATAVSYFGRCTGGDFAFYPKGAQGPPQTIPARHDTAVILDTDSVFHGVDRVSETPDPMAALQPGMQLEWESGGSWRVGSEADPIARYRADEVRFSVSWKAYCYADEAEERAAREHSDDISRERALEVLFADLRERGRLGDALPERRELALLMVDEYVKFPPARARAA